MNIAVLGMWHLGTVTAGCLAKAGYSVIGYDQKSDTVAMLKNGVVPVNEPGLSKLIQMSVERGQLRFSSHLTDIA
ncbi:MAG: UDP-glucose 6-dehydrogenase, partial [Deltaproteobacteria bacterium]|nr:UDP-glucose 6-dehydrogenase [Deltaproteobacteria bacterium]